MISYFWLLYFTASCISLAGNINPTSYSISHQTKLIPCYVVSPLENYYTIKMPVGQFCLVLFFWFWSVIKLEQNRMDMTSFPAHLKESEGRRQAGGKINVLLGRPANIPTSLPPLTSGSDQGRQREREDASYWLASVHFQAQTVRHHIARPPTQPHSPYQQNKMKQDEVI